MLRKIIAATFAHGASLIRAHLEGKEIERGKEKEERIIIEKENYLRRIHSESSARVVRAAAKGNFAVGLFAPALESF